MSDVSHRTPVGRILSERFGSVFQRLPLSPDPLIAYALLVVFCEVGVLQTLRVLEGYQPFFLTSPLWLLRPLILVGAAIVTRQLHRSYGLAVKEMALSERVDDATRFDRLVPPKLAWGFILIGVTFTLGNALLVVGLPTLLSWPIAARLNWLVIVPFGYVPIFAMFLSTYLSIEVIVPHRIDSSDQLGLYYHDPENLGGMRPVGELMKHAYYYLLVGLVLYAIALYGPYILQGVFAWEGGSVVEPGLMTNVLFTAVWALSVGVMMYGSIGYTDLCIVKSVSGSGNSMRLPVTTSITHGVSKNSLFPRSHGTHTTTSDLGWNLSQRRRSIQRRSRCGFSSVLVFSYRKLFRYFSLQSERLSRILLITCLT
ncbi:hypothetical protein [Salinibaculum rarum]|uniref:hypothetical protein n=1 Tax=Salinibaculum rarum TaxID=3058903 RepID=UPI00265DB136|nr:hypothetical protein [Salinibaculum sp. KK48]